MEVEIAARHGHLSPEHMAEVRSRAEKLVHYYDRLTYVTVTADLSVAHEKTVEVIAKCEHKHDFVGVGVGPDVLVALGLATDKVKVQIKHHKERTQDHRRDPSHGGPDGIRA